MDIVDRLEDSGTVGAVARPVHTLVSRIMRPGRIRDVLSGKALGHPAHPALVALPLGLWLSSVLAGLLGERRAARWLTAAGLVTALPTIATGLSDWTDTEGAEQRIGAVHLGANATATALFTMSWWSRRQGRHARATTIGVLGSGFLAAGGWLGGHLAYALGVGVDTNAFGASIPEWTTVDGDDGDGPFRAARASGISLLVVGEQEQDPPVVMANRCSHRGGPLAEGRLIGDCVECPWHGSRFRVPTGRVACGPAVAAQPVFEVRRSSKGLEVRREDARTLRRNPVRA
jgi:nitrite reductase/ring-hydroxylating ferredoxin subunit/uncharacterized membrane protein